MRPSFAVCVRWVSLWIVYGALTIAPSWAEPELARGLTVSEVLKIVAEAPQHDARVQLLLKSGAAVSGTVTSASADIKTVVLRQADNSTVVVDATQVDSVSINDPGSAKVALLGGKISRGSTDEVPSPLTLRRRLETMAKDTPQIMVQLSEEQQTSSDCRFYTDKVLTAIERAVADFRKDDLGRKALRSKGAVITVTTAPGLPLEVRLVESNPHVSFDCSSALPGDFSVVIARGLESVL